VIPRGTIVSDTSAVLQADNVRQHAGDDSGIFRHALITIDNTYRLMLPLVITHTRATNVNVVLQSVAAVVNNTGRHYRLV
jgi:hypothetical protein